MRHLFVAVAATIAASFAVPAAAQTPEQQRQLDWVLERGRLLYALDRAAWVATDDMVERVPREQQQDLRGYIVDRDGQDYVVIFFADEGGQPVALFRAKVSGGRVVDREVFPRGSRPVLSASQQRLARVRQHLAAAQLNLTMCSSRPPNLAAIPPATPDSPIDIYITTPQTETNIIPFGGHHRLTLDAAGRITAQRAFTNSCLNMALGRPTVALAVSHLLDPLPTEIHVFSAMSARMMVAVAAGGSVWEVTGEHIRFMSRLDSQN